MEVLSKLLGMVWNEGLNCCSHLVHPLLQSPEISVYEGWMGDL